MIRRSFLAALALVAALVAVALVRPAAAAEARPPVGQWYGEFPDGSGVRLIVQGDGSAMYQPTGANPVVGNADWRPTSPVGGILTITYRSVGFVNHLYFSCVWVDGRSFVLSDPYFKVLMRKQ